jgi:hypothetical protein
MTTVEEPEVKERQLTLNDRCDSKDCGAAALVKVIGVTGELFFCGHHYNKIVDTPSGYDKLMAFSFNIVDERWTMQNENRLKGGANN